MVGIMVAGLIALPDLHYRNIQTTNLGRSLQSLNP